MRWLLNHRHATTKPPADPIQPPVRFPRVAAAKRAVLAWTVTTTPVALLWLIAAYPTIGQVFVLLGLLSGVRSLTMVGWQHRFATMRLALVLVAVGSWAWIGGGVATSSWRGAALVASIIGSCAVLIAVRRIRERREPIKIVRATLSWAWGDTAHHSGAQRTWEVIDVRQPEPGVLVPRVLGAIGHLAEWLKSSQAQLGAIARARVEVHPDPDRPDMADVRMDFNARWEATPMAWPGRGGAWDVEHRRVLIGTAARQEPWLPLVETNVGIIGKKGSGKTSAVQSILATIADRPGVQFMATNFGHDLGMFADAPNCVGFANTVEEAAAMLHEFDTATMAQRRTMIEHDRLGAPLHVRADVPVIVVVIDEYTDLVEHAPELHKMIVRWCKKDRKTNVVVHWATQRPTNSWVGADLLANTDVRVVLRVEEEQDSRRILGKDATRRGADASKLPEPHHAIVRTPTQLYRVALWKKLSASALSTYIARQNAPHGPVAAPPAATDAAICGADAAPEPAPCGDVAARRGARHLGIASMSGDLDRVTKHPGWARLGNSHAAPVWRALADRPGAKASELVGERRSKDTVERALAVLEQTGLAVADRSSRTFTWRAVTVDVAGILAGSPDRRTTTTTTTPTTTPAARVVAGAGDGTAYADASTFTWTPAGDEPADDANGDAA